MGLRRRTPVTILTLALATAALAAPATGGRARVDEVLVREGASPAIELTLSAPVAPVLRRLGNPPRVYVDLPDAVLGRAVARAIEGSGAVREVRLGQFDARTVRVVVELDAAARADLETAGNVVRITLGASVTQAKAPVAKPAVPESKVVPAKAAAAKAAPAPPVADETPRLAVARTETPLVPFQAETSARDARRPAVASTAALEERIARRCAAEDWTGVVVLYAANTRAVRNDVDSTTRAAVVDALRELGLTYSARKLLGPAGATDAPALRIARAELALADGDANDAATCVSGLEDGLVDPVLGPKLRALRVRLALARGDLDDAAAGIGSRAAPELRAALASAALGAGRAATDGRICRKAIVAYRQALDADGGRTARAAAAAGLVRAALACDDPEATTMGLGVLAESPHPLLRRAAAIIAGTETDVKRETTGTRRGE